MGDGSDLRLTNDGVIRQNHANLLVVLRGSPEWHDVVHFDEFSQVYRLNKPVPRRDGQKLNFFTPRYWSDHDLAEATEWFQLGENGRAIIPH